LIRDVMHEPYNTTPDSQTDARGWAVYQCVNGCVHVRLNGVMLTFTDEEFAQLAQLIGDAYVRLSVRAAVANVTAH